VRDPLPEFLMEDWLEAHRLTAPYNAGESGHRPQSLHSLLTGLQPDFDFNLNDALLAEELHDAPNLGLAELREEVARLHPGATADHVLITTGTSEALLLLLRQLKPQKIAAIVPAFQLLIEIPRSLGSAIVPLPLQWSENGIPAAPVQSWIEILQRETPDVFIFNHPHNPSGLFFSAAERAALLETCDDIGCTVIGDEHYRFLVAPENEQKNASEKINVGPTVWEQSARRRFVTGSFIKCAGTPGLRLGWCVGDPRVLCAMQSEKNYLTHTVNPLSQRLALWFLQSFDRSQSFFRPLFNDWLQNRAELRQWLKNDVGWNGRPPDGGLVSCVFSKSDSTEESVFRELRERGCFLLPLSTFEPFSPRHVQSFAGFRLGMGITASNFKKLLSVMVL